MKRSVWQGLLCGALGLAWAGGMGPLPSTAAQGLSVTVRAEADTYVDSGSAAGNLGTQPVLEVAPPSPDPTRQVLVRFTVAGLAEHVSSAKLRRYVRNGSPSGPARRGMTRT